MLIDDHINLQGGSPLAFRGVEQLGTRFTDMSAPYDQQSGRILQEIAKENGFPLHKGVYVSVVGPQLETRAEYRYLKNHWSRCGWNEHGAGSDCCKPFKDSYCSSICIDR